MADIVHSHIPYWGKIALAFIAIAIGLQIISTYSWDPTPESLLDDVEIPKNIVEKNQKYGQKRIIKVVEGIHVAAGYSLGNSILIEAPNGVIIVDTTESCVAAREIFAGFRNITNAPVKGIIFTHHHMDHRLGTKAFLEGNEGTPQIWAHELFIEEQVKTSETSQAHFSRGVRQFGPLLPDRVVGSYRLRSRGDAKEAGSVQPTHFLRKPQEDIEIAGLSIRLIHIPGETPDHMAVWIPSVKVLLSGDNIYGSFPNLYALRGTPPRNTMTWAKSMSVMRSLKPEVLVPSHTHPIRGQEKIDRVLQDYGDAIQFVHDQTVRYINKGFHPNDIVPLVSLPAEQKANPFLQETYGTVKWSVKGVYDQYMGWFSGYVTDIESMTTIEKASRMVKLAGGVGKLASAAQEALDEGDHRWALELASHIFRLDPEFSQAKQIRLKAIKALAAKETSSNGRNYYLSIALEDHNLIENKITGALKRESINSMSLKRIFRTIALKLKAEEVEGLHEMAVFNFTDVEKVFTLELRNSIIDVQEGHVPENYDVMITLDSTTWRNLILEDINPATAYMKGDISIEGGILAFKRFMGYIEKTG